ncbi:MAG: Mur ligase family protein [Bryobacteraceae bacterium]
MRRGWGNAVSVLVNLPLVFAAMVWRACLRKTTFIAITGSLGKTTAKECLAAILAGIAPTTKTQGTANGRYGLPRTILCVRPRHRYAVVEAGTDGPGNMIRSSLTLRPDAVVVLNVARTHTQSYRDLDQTAREKSRLMRFLDRKGFAVLNAGDERVRRMTPPRGQRVFCFGNAPDSDVRAEDVRAQWPGRLEFTAVCGGERCRVRTQLVGAHWLDSALAAIATARALGVSLDMCAEGLAGASPYTGRLSPWPTNNGATILRDDFNGSVDSFERAVQVLRDARATRKILVVSDCSDFRAKPRKRMHYYADVGREAAAMVVFIGERCDQGVERAVRQGMAPECAHGFCGMRDAAEFLKGELREGDLVLLRGQTYQHLGRICHLLEGSIACERTHCDRTIVCDDCSELKFRRTSANAAPPVA